MRRCRQTPSLPLSAMAPCTAVLLALTACCLAVHAVPAVVPVKEAGFQTIGTCHPNDTLLHAETVYKPSKWMRVRHQLVTYPADESEQPAGVISCLQFSAHKTTHPGSVAVQSGGPGQRQVTVMVKSERGHSVGWNVLIYGTNE